MRALLRRVGAVVVWFRNDDWLADGFLLGVTPAHREPNEPRGLGGTVMTTVRDPVRHRILTKSVLVCSAFTLALIVSRSRPGLAQARVLSAPPEPSLLNITRQWSRASSLGDLRELRAEGDYRELRVWLGFGLTTETQGVILRRANGRWSAFFARVMRCEIQIPRTVGDTASRATMERYNAEARKRCGTTVADVTPGSQVVTTDTLLVAPLSLPDSTVEAAWTAAVRAGVSQLPPRVAHSANVDDAAVFVVELRNGNDYRASTIEQLERPETEADQQVKDIYAAVVTRLRSP